jgi:N-methylhydantoinase A
MGVAQALSFDVGGTTAKASLVLDGRMGVNTLHMVEATPTFAGYPVQTPVVEIVEIGAGGGSIAWVDAAGGLHVGPRSAGAEPGPACYGRGGSEPTVTDANLMLGYLAVDAPLAGRVELDVEAAERVISELAEPLEVEPVACAEGILRVANAEMVRALRVVTVQRGIDPRSHALLAFGGAGGLHAARIADELGMDTILCPRASGVLAALGLVVSPRRRDVQRSVLLSGEELTAQAIAQVTEELGKHGRQALAGDDAELQATYELRYRGQSFELPIQGAVEADPEELREAFEREHEHRYGYRDREQALELVTIRVTATAGALEVELAGDERREPARQRRTAILDGEEVELEVLRGAPPPKTPVEGPAVVELPESTLLVPRGWGGEVDATGTVRVSRHRRQ